MEGSPRNRGACEARIRIGWPMGPREHMRGKDPSDYDHDLAVPCQRLVGCHEPHGFDDRLSNQYPIEWVTVIPDRQTSRRHGMLPCDRKLHESCFAKAVQQIRRFNPDPAVRRLDGDFPRRYRTDKDSVSFLYELPRFGR